MYSPKDIVLLKVKNFPAVLLISIENALLESSIVMSIQSLSLASFDEVCLSSPAISIGTVNGIFFSVVWSV